MAENSKIEWTDHTFNPWLGCTKVSPACKFCYAERDMDHRYGKVKWGDKGTRIITSEENWRKPLRWNREAGEKGIRYRVFCASLADVFEDWKGPIHNHRGEQIDSTMDDIRRDLFELIDATPNLDWLLLTKRPERIRAKWHPFNWQTPSDVPHRPNVWLGTSVESSSCLSRVDTLKASGGLAPVLFLSCEPLLGALPTLGEHIDGIDWVIAGGESGPEARPSNPDWFRSIRDQCEMHGVPFHFKQWGEWAPYGDLTYDRCKSVDTHAFDEEACVSRVGKHAAGRLLDGQLHNTFPKRINTVAADSTHW
ncbi:phage Gp37/Gp68 family protein [Pirellulaceae bacterium SH467]